MLNYPPLTHIHISTLINIHSISWIFNLDNSISFFDRALSRRNYSYLIDIISYHHSYFFDYFLRLLTASLQWHDTKVL